MAITKSEALDQLSGPGAVSNQQALVKKIQGTTVSQPVKRIIPGGKTLQEDLSESTLPHAVYNWLRYSRHWTEGVISFCSDLTSRKTRVKKVIDFDSKTKNSEWEIRGKRWLSERIAEVLTQDNILAVKINREGLQAVTDAEGTFSPESEDWEPYVELTPFRPPSF